MIERSHLKELEDRGILEQVSNRGLAEQLLAKPGASFYVGYDPTAASLHVGHLLPIVTMARLQRLGAKPIVLVGGATGVVGDPSGRATERSMLSLEELETNKAAISRQLSRLINFSGVNAAILVDNADWIAPISFLGWLRDVGKLFTVNYMLAKESVRRRLEERDQGITYTEFSYMLLQAYDFLHLFKHFDCRLQLGGSDQWGNITAGIDLVRKTLGEEAVGLTLPLLTTAAGEKFGKSAGNAVWLEENLTSPYRFHQFWLSQADSAVERLLKLFTFLSLREIAELMEAHRVEPERRLAQRTLAAQVTRMVHGEEAQKRAERAGQALFGGDLESLTRQEIEEVFAEAPASALPSELLRPGAALADILLGAGIVSSKAEARRLAAAGGLYLNGKRLEALGELRAADLEAFGFLVVRTGKRSYHLVRPQGTLERTEE
jgi:tyrosyl-tRNA synthetase